MGKMQRVRDTNSMGISQSVTRFRGYMTRAQLGGTTDTEMRERARQTCRWAELSNFIAKCYTNFFLPIDIYFFLFSSYTGGTIQTHVFQFSEKANTMRGQMIMWPKIFILQSA